MTWILLWLIPLIIVWSLAIFIAKDNWFTLMFIGAIPLMNVGFLVYSLITIINDHVIIRKRIIKENQGEY